MIGSLGQARPVSEILRAPLPENSRVETKLLDEISDLSCEDREFIFESAISQNRERTFRTDVNPTKRRGEFALLVVLIVLSYSGNRFLSSTS